MPPREATVAPSTPGPPPGADSLERETPRGRRTSTAQHAGSSSSSSNIPLGARRAGAGAGGRGGLRRGALQERSCRCPGAAGRFQPKESTSPASQLGPSIASGQWGLMGKDMGRYLSDPARVNGGISNLRSPRGGEGANNSRQEAEGVNCLPLSRRPPSGSLNRKVRLPPAR